MDMGLDRLKNLLMDMAALSEKTVEEAILAYTEGRNVREQIFSASEKLRLLQDEASELAVELIARYQPLASDLRFIKSCMEISYGFSRFGRYAYDISEVMDVFGDLSSCDRSGVEGMGRIVVEMIRTSINAFFTRDTGAAAELATKDDEVDGIYREHIRGMVTAGSPPLQGFRCQVSATLILRYLERIADHALYIADSTAYIVKGERTYRR